jgi:hypothetical protein
MTRAKQSFIDRGDFEVAGRRALVAGVKNVRATIMMHWIPYHVPMAAVVDQFRHVTRIKVLNARFETTKVGNREVRMLVRCVTVEATATSWVPHLIRWRHDGTSGQGLVTMAGRPGVCLRCLSASHFRGTDAPSSAATAASGGSTRAKTAPLMGNIEQNISTVKTGTATTKSGVIGGWGRIA